MVLIAGMIFAATSYKRLQKAYNKYDNAITYSNYSGAEFAEFAIPKLGLNTKIALTSKDLGDYYIPKKDLMVISNRTAQRRSVASVCITAHELGHAVQKKSRSKLLRLQYVVFTLNKIFQFLFAPILIGGIVLLFFEQYFAIGRVLILVALASLLLSYLLKIVTIPVEYNASKIAYNFLKESHVLVEDELKSAKKMLNVAAGTYVASLFLGFLNFFRAIVKAFSR